MPQFDLDSMSKDDLEKLRSDIDRALATLTSRRRVEARKAAEQAAREFGFSLEEVVTAEKSAKRGGAAAPGPARYRNPADPKKTWTGRGRQPGWIKDGLAAGKQLADFAIG